jgi:manganese efflux pump family protein
VLRLLALVLPLALDTFAVAAALGVAGLSPSQRLRVSLVFAGFEAGMPLIGVAIGHALGDAVGSLADYVASAALVVLGTYLIFSDDDDEAEKVATLWRIHGLAIVGLGISISLDELAIGFSIGLLRLPLIWAIVLIGAQAFVAAQIGVRVGNRVSERVREHLEHAAGVALITLGIVFLVARAAS